MDQVVRKSFINKLELCSNRQNFFEINQLDSIKQLLNIFSFSQNVRLHFNFIKINLFNFSVFFKAFCIFLDFHGSFIKLYFDKLTLVLSNGV